jgi:hypothetical protein
MNGRTGSTLAIALAATALGAPAALGTDRSERASGSPAPSNAGAAQAPQRLGSRPALRNYACLHRSQAYTGFEEPTFRFRLKRKGVWIDRTTGSPTKGEWRWRDSKLTLYSKRGSKLHTFAHFRDSSGKYLRQHPEPANNDALICR